MMQGIRLSWRIFMVAGLIWAASALAAQTGEATQAIRQSIDQLLKMLNDPELKKSENKEKRRSEIMKVIGSRFDFGEMSRRSLGIHWRDLKGKDRKEFVDLFSELLKDTYIGKIEQYTNEKILYKLEESTGPGRAEVQTVIVTASAEIPLYYQCMVVGKDWRVYDVAIQGVSLVNNYRSQFNQILLKESVEGLIAKLKTKVQEIKAIQ
jgi:phospholipid transport system substrate-binding protein